jgi:hypothetical protein
MYNLYNLTSPGSINLKKHQSNTGGGGGGGGGGGEYTFILNLFGGFYHPETTGFYRHVNMATDHYYNWLSEKNYKRTELKDKRFKQ